MHVKTSFWIRRHLERAAKTSCLLSVRIPGPRPHCISAAFFCLTLYFLVFFFNWNIVALQRCVSAVRKHESAISICMSPPSWTPSHLPPPHPSRSSQSTELSSLCCAAASCKLSDFDTAVYICQCYSLSSSHPPRPPLGPQVCSLFSTSLSLFLPCK